jgi:hypothetical protein
MSTEDNKDQQEQEYAEGFKLLEDIPEGTTTDVVTDLKMGIYNLYLNLLNYLMVEYGSVEAIKISTGFLDQISNTFKDTLSKE